ncbi:MAG: RloB family protein [Proteobacteria bacterium]|nr:RloB family protein [Pseudomonadota bacterium]MBU1641146.1 RloB family protein [Pseudomonadota bacterium]
MGKSDQLFNKKKARDTASLKRRHAKRAQYEMVLIVCEGAKSEPNYLRALIDNLQLNTANIKVLKNTAGSSPRTIVDFALKEYRQEKGYDRVYCVFDKDQHTTYFEALDIINRANIGKGHRILATTSVPCFEFWILLHYKYTTKPFAVPHGSICAKVISDLKAYMPGYQKGDNDTYNATKDLIATAIENAKKVARHCEIAGTDMPSTQMYELVEYLQNLKN